MIGAKQIPRPIIACAKGFRMLKVVMNQAFASCRGTGAVQFVHVQPVSLWLHRSAGLQSAVRGGPLFAHDVQASSWLRVIDSPEP